VPSAEQHMLKRLFKFAHAVILPSTEDGPDSKFRRCWNGRRFHSAQYSRRQRPTLVHFRKWDVAAVLRTWGRALPLAA
jgi:hypothetical protein